MKFQISIFSYENISVPSVLLGFSYGYTSAYSEQTPAKERTSEKVLCESVKSEWINKHIYKEDAKGQKNLIGKIFHHLIVQHAKSKAEDKELIFMFLI